jgi:hypothetical protein
VTESLEGCPLKLRGQAELLEPVDQVVGQLEEMEVGLVGEEMARGNRLRPVSNSPCLAPNSPGLAMVGVWESDMSTLRKRSWTSSELAIPTPLFRYF